MKVEDLIVGKSYKITEPVIRKDGAGCWFVEGMEYLSNYVFKLTDDIFSTVCTTKGEYVYSYLTYKGWALDIDWLSLVEEEPKEYEITEDTDESLVSGRLSDQEQEIVDNGVEEMVLNYKRPEEKFVPFDDSPCGLLLAQAKINKAKGVKSTGGSSDYYKLRINDSPVETEDIIRDVFGNDFDFGNAFKSLVIAYKTTQGTGKSGNDVLYECNKIDYSVNKIRKQGEV